MKKITPIAIFRSPFNSKFGIPRQSGLVEELVGRIIFVPEYRREEALKGLEDFDYLWLIWGFHQNEERENEQKSETGNERNSKITVRPPRLGGNERIGVFASRSPFRPNGLGLSSVRFSRIVNGEIEVLGADLMDGTPIYDIKPYIAYADSHPNARGGFTDQHEWKKLQVDMDGRFRRMFSADMLQALCKTLELDPRPHYHHDARRIYGMPFAHYDIRFRVDGDRLTVVDVNKGSITPNPSSTGEGE